MRQYLDLVKHVLATGTRKENRTGVDTISTFGHYYEHDLHHGFPLLTTKHISWKNIVVELLWFLSGQTDIRILQRHGCKFWDAWADESGKVPSAYGSFWRHFPVHEGGSDPVVARVRLERAADDSTVYEHDVPDFNDQIAWVLAELRKNPMSRRMVVSAWAPGHAQTSQLPPCHCLFMFNVQNETRIEHHPPKENDDGRTLVPTVVGTKKRLCLHLTQRSCDVALGVPYNLASYALLLHLFAQFSGLEPGVFGHTLVDAHIYTAKPNGGQAEYDHVPGLRVQIERDPRRLPRLRLDPSLRDLKDVEALMHPSLTTDEVMQRFVLEGYEPYGPIPFKVAV